MSDRLRFRSAEMGGNFTTSSEDIAKEGNPELKLSNDFGSGGDMRLETDGRRFIAKMGLQC